jgi:hypothetical protein
VNYSPWLNYFAGFLALAAFAIWKDDHTTAANLALTAATINFIAWVFSLGEPDNA